MVKLMDNTVIHEVYNSVKQAFFTVIEEETFILSIICLLPIFILPIGYYYYQLQCKTINA